MLEGEDKIFLETIAATLIENKLMFEAIANMLDRLHTESGVESAAMASSMLRDQVSRIDSVLGGKYKESRDETDTNTL